MRYDLLIVGAGGLGREVLQYAADSFDPGCWNIRGFLDDNPFESDEQGRNLAVGVVGDTWSYRIGENDRFLVAIGDPEVRAQLVARLRDRGGRFATLVHPQAYVAPNAKLGEGCIVSPFATLASTCRVGEQAVLGFYAHVGHDAAIGAYSVLSPYAAVNGAATLGEGVFMGTHSVVTPGICVGDRTKVAAGSVVYKDVPADRLAVGNPAKAGPRLGA